MDQTHTPCNGSVGSYPLDHQGSPEEGGLWGEMIQLGDGVMGWGGGARALQMFHGGLLLDLSGFSTAPGAQGFPWTPHAHPLPVRDEACSSLLESTGGLLTSLGTPPPQAWAPWVLGGGGSGQQEITECSLSPALVPGSSGSLVLIISFHLPYQVPKGLARPVKAGKVQSKLQTGLIYGTCQPRQGS